MQFIYKKAKQWEYHNHLVLLELLEKTYISMNTILKAFLRSINLLIYTFWLFAKFLGKSSFWVLFGGKMMVQISPEIPPVEVSEFHSNFSRDAGVFMHRWR